MLRSMNDLKGYAIGATDGIIGHVEDFYFDDKVWVIRYLVVDAGTWLRKKKVPIKRAPVIPPSRRMPKKRMPPRRPYP